MICNSCKISRREIVYAILRRGIRYGRCMELPDAIRQGETLEELEVLKIVDQ